MEYPDKVRELLQKYAIFNEELVYEIALIIVEAQEEQIIKDFEKKEKKL